MRVDFTVDGSPADWAPLIDPALLATRVPGCRSATPAGDVVVVIADVALAGAAGTMVATIRSDTLGGVRIAGSGRPGTVDLHARFDGDVVAVSGEVDGDLACVGSGILVAGARRIAAALLAPAAGAGPAPADAAAATPSGSGRSEPSPAHGRAGKVAAGVAAGAAVAAAARSILHRKDRR